jgi:hypothetical protein
VQQQQQQQQQQEEQLIWFQQQCNSLSTFALLRATLNSLRVDQSCRRREGLANLSTGLALSSTDTGGCLTTLLCWLLLLLLLLLPAVLLPGSAYQALVGLIWGCWQAIMLCMPTMPAADSQSPAATAAAATSTSLTSTCCWRVHVPCCTLGAAVSCWSPLRAQLAD